MTTTMTTSNINSIKVIFGSELRRFPYPLSSNGGNQFELFSDLLKHTFGLESTTIIKLTYKDDENGEVTIASQMELEEALLSVQQSPILRINLTVVKPMQSVVVPITATTTATAATKPETTVKATSSTETTPNIGTIAAWKEHLAKNKVLYAKQLCELKEKHNLTDVPEAVLVKQLAISNGNIDFVLSKQQKRKERQQQRQQKVTEIMHKYPQQVKALQEMGYNIQPPIAIWLLKKHDGDLSKVIDSISNNNNNNNGRKCNKFQMRQMYATQLKELSELGFNGPRLVWLLHKCDGDVSKVVEKRLNRINHITTLTSKYEEQLRQLSAKGYCFLPVNIRLLNKFNGDVAKVESKLAKRRSNRSNNNNNNSNANRHRSGPFFHRGAFIMRANCARGRWNNTNTNTNTNNTNANNANKNPHAQHPHVPGMLMRMRKRGKPCHFNPRFANGKCNRNGNAFGNDRCNRNANCNKPTNNK